MSQFSSDYLDARVSIFASRLFSSEQLLDLIDLDLHTILRRINESSGQGSSIDLDAIGGISSQLSKNALNDFQILLRPFSGNARRFFYYAIRWFELVNLKVLIRGKFSSIPSADIEKNMVDLGSFIDLPVKKLLETEDPHEMLRLLETTAYAGIVRQARYVYDEHGNDLFLLDATIDRSFFIDLNQRTRFLHPDDAKYVKQVLGNLLDRFNLLWLLRYRFSYGLSPAKSYYLLTAIGNKLHAAELMRLARLESVEQLVAELPEPFHHLLKDYRVIADMESVIEYITLEVAARQLVSKNNLLARTFSYILLREAQVRFLQALIKGKQLGFDRQLIQQAVGGI